jgi:hypothetical protein
MNVGDISDPVRTEFGFHIIRLDDKKTVQGVPQIQASHILLQIIAGPETVDSLTRALEAVRAQLENSRNNADSVAAAHGLNWSPASYVSRSEGIAAVGHMSGMNHFLFSDARGRAPFYSEVLQNDNFVALFEKQSLQKAGTPYLPYFKEGIVAKLTQADLMQQAVTVLEQYRTLVVEQGSVSPALLAKMPKAAYDTLRSVGPDGFAPKIGYSSMVLQQIIAQESNLWGSVLPGEGNAVLARVLEVQKPDAEVIASRIPTERLNLSRFSTTNLLNDYLAFMERTAKVEEFLDLHYRE